MAAAPALRSYEGSCHCGALEFTYETRRVPRAWVVQACQCGFCRGHGSLATADPAGVVQFRYVYPDRLRRYRFGLRTADYLLCRECGVCIAAVLMTGSGAVASIHVNTLRERPRGLATARPQGCRPETVEVRRARRRDGWTPVFGPV